MLHGRRCYQQMPPYRLAHLTPDQMAAIEGLENDLGLTLVAYDSEPGAYPEPPNYQEEFSEELDYPLDAILESYRTYDPL